MNETILSKMKEMKLMGMARAFQASHTAAADQRLSADELVELLVTALTGAALGFEASSFFVDAGNRPRLGQAFLVVDPDAFAGQAVYDERVETLIAAMLQDPGVRLPGARREALALTAARDGIAVPDALAADLARLAAL